MKPKYVTSPTLTCPGTSLPVDLTQGTFCNHILGYSSRTGNLRGSEVRLETAVGSLLFSVTEITDWLYSNASSWRCYGYGYNSNNI